MELATALVAVGTRAREDEEDEERGEDAPWRLETPEVRLAWRPDKQCYAVLRMHGVADGLESVYVARRLEEALAWLDMMFPGAVVSPAWHQCPLPKPVCARALRP